MVEERQGQRRNSTHADCAICGPTKDWEGGTGHLTHPNPPCCSPGLRVGRWEAVQHAELSRAEVADQPTRSTAHAQPLDTRQPVAHAQSLLARSVSPCRARGSAPTGSASLPCSESSISGFPPPLPPPPQPPPRSFSFAGSVVIPDQNGGCGTSQFLWLFSAGISLDLHGRLLGQRANIGQRWRCSRRRRGRAEPLVTTPPLPGSPLALPALRTPRDRCAPELGTGPQPPPRRAEAGSIPPALRPRLPASACALLPARSCILSEVSTRSRSKLPTGKNVLLLGKCAPVSLHPVPPCPYPAGVRSAWRSPARFVRTADPGPAPLRSATCR